MGHYEQIPASSWILSFWGQSIDFLCIAHWNFDHEVCCMLFCSISGMVAGLDIPSNDIYLHVVDHMWSICPSHSLLLHCGQAPDWD